jgi:hypothetical protein
MKTLVKKVIEENEPPSSFIRRVGDIKALELVKAGDWLYTSKLQWKTEVRDANKKEETPKKKSTKKGKKSD